MDCDVCVIGGGIAGTSAAARLSSMGHVILCEAETALGTQASGRSAALYEAHYGPPSTVALNLASRAYHDAADVLSPRGLLLVSRPEDVARFDTDRQSMQLDEISLDQATTLLPILDSARITRAAYQADAQDIDTDRLLQTFARTAKDNGADLRLNAPVHALRPIAGGWEVQAGTETLTARKIVNAAGAWADIIAQMANVAPLGLRPLRRSMARVPAPDGYDISTWPMLFGPGEAWYSKPDAGALLISPADEDLTQPHDAWAEDLTIAEGIARYEDHVTYSVTRLLATWAGLRTFAPDGTLVLGPDPSAPNFIWCAGQGGYGMQSAPAASQLLADLLGGAPSDLDANTVARLSPNRFR